MSEFVPAFRRAINEFLARPGSRPPTRAELARAMGLSPAMRRELRRLLAEMLREGEVVRLPGKRWAAPARNTVRRRIGRLEIRPGGSAVARLDDSGRVGEPAAVRIGSADRSGALSGDLVEIEPWPARGGSGRLPRGRVLRVVARTRDTVVGLFRHTRFSDHVIPDDAGFGSPVAIAGVPADRAERLDGHKVVVRLDARDPGPSPLRGTVREDLGEERAPGVDMLCLLRRREIRTEHPPAARRAARRAPGDPSPADRRDRRDLRGTEAFTVDPETARDFDDAVHAARRPDGSWLLDVHIADVSHFVRRGDAVDREARRRGNSVYLVDRAIPMLPPELTEDVCSLAPGRDRLVRTVRMELDAGGRVRRADFFRSVIRSRARFSYERVERALRGDDAAVPSPFGPRLRDMDRLARILRERRRACGALDVNLPEVDCLLDSQGRVAGWRRRGAPAAYALIEECMLLANQAMAARLNAAGRAGLYRVHEEPDPAQWARMEEELAGLGRRLRARDRAAVNGALAPDRGSAREAPLSLAVLRNLKRAEYAAAPGPHFGLAIEPYTHFTSPIRRYPDLVVHRLLDALERGIRAPYARAQLGEIARHCSETERAADEAAAESLDIKRLEYFAGRLRSGRTGPYPAVIMGRHPRGLLVELTDSLLRGMIPFDLLRRGRGRPRDGPRPGEAIRVDLARVDPAARQVDFRPSPAGAPVGGRRVSG